MIIYVLYVLFYSCWSSCFIVHISKIFHNLYFVVSKVFNILCFIVSFYSSRWMIDVFFKFSLSTLTLWDDYLRMSSLCVFYLDCILWRPWTSSSGMQKAGGPWKWKISRPWKWKISRPWQGKIRRPWKGKRILFMNSYILMSEWSKRCLLQLLSFKPMWLSSGINNQ